MASVKGQRGSNFLSLFDRKPYFTSKLLKMDQLGPKKNSCQPPLPMTDKFCISTRPVARSGFGGVLFQAKVDFFACLRGESGIFCSYFGNKWTFLRAFLEKVDVFAY